jgi:hypothetical protein
MTGTALLPPLWSLRGEQERAGSLGETDDSPDSSLKKKDKKSSVLFKVVVTKTKDSSLGLITGGHHGRRNHPARRVGPASSSSRMQGNGDGGLVLETGKDEEPAAQRCQQCERRDSVVACRQCNLRLCKLCCSKVKLSLVPGIFGSVCRRFTYKHMLCSGSFTIPSKPGIMSSNLLPVRNLPSLRRHACLPFCCIHLPI